MRWHNVYSHTDTNKKQLYEISIVCHRDHFDNRLGIGRICLQRRVNNTHTIGIGYYFIVVRLHSPRFGGLSSKGGGNAQLSIELRQVSESGALQTEGVLESETLS